MPPQTGDRTHRLVASFLSLLVVSAVLITASGPVAAHPAEDAWNDGPHCHTQLFGPLDVLLTMVGMFLGLGFVMFITPINMDCHGGGPVSV